MLYFIVFMVASAIVQIVMKFYGSFHKKATFPYFSIETQDGRYRLVLKKINHQVDDYIERYKKYLNRNFLPAKSYEKMVDELSNDLYSHLNIHQDFLTFNLGYSNTTYPIELVYPQITYNEDSVALERFQKKMDKKISGISGKKNPTPFSLIENKTFAIQYDGLNKNLFNELINKIIMDLAIYQGPDTLTICTIFDLEFDLMWTRFLPHSFYGNRRLVYCGNESHLEFKQLLENAFLDQNQHFVAFVDVEFALANDLYDIFNRDKLPSNLSVVFFSNNTIPPRVKKDIHCKYSRKKYIGYLEEKEYSFEYLSSDECERLAKKLYNIELNEKTITLTSSIPTKLSFYELHKVKRASKIEKLDTANQSDIQNHFPVLIGVGENSQVINIDLTNDGDGNHCLVTGTTGSGKSQFILTYVLSACAKYSPEYLGFVVIDFKGGDLSRKISDLPHCQGEFINDNGEVSQREIMRIATLLESEINYRQKIINKYCNSSSSDISEYHEMYAKGLVEEPLPRLLIIVDEVAVFFEKDPKNIDYISHIATVGRSVGMVLLLSTQSKNGNIIEQIRTNINVKVDFLSEEDRKKKEIVKGRAIINSYLKHDLSCQIAISNIYDSNDSSVNFMTLSGQNRYFSLSLNETQLQKTKNEISLRYQKYDENDILTETLEKTVKFFPLDVLNETYEPNRSYPVGIYDNIYDRSRDPLMYDIDQYHLLIYGKPQSGKTNFLKTLIVSLCNIKQGLTPDDLAIYIVAKNPDEFNYYHFPQVGSVLHKNNIYYFLLYLIKEVHIRQKAESLIGYRHIVAMIDDCIEDFSTNEEILNMIEFLTKEALKYKISIIMTLSYRPLYYKDSLNFFDKKIVFSMNDDYDYQGIITLNNIKELPEITGRCFSDIESKTMEAQIALPYEISEKEVLDQSLEYNEIWFNKELPTKIPLMPKSVQLKFDINPYIIPVGLHKNLDIAYWNMNQVNSYLISYASTDVVLPFIIYLIEVFNRTDFELIVVDNEINSVKNNLNLDGFIYFAQNQQVELLKYLDENELNKTRVLLMFDYAKCLFPFSGEEKMLVSKINELLIDKTKRFYGVFAERKDFVNLANYSSTHIGKLLENASSGLLLGDIPQNHVFGYNHLSIKDQTKPLEYNWAIHISPINSESGKIKIAVGVDE